MSSHDVKAKPGADAHYLTIADRAELVRRERSYGYNDAEIARRTGLCSRTVLRIRKRLGLPAVPR